MSKLRKWREITAPCMRALHLAWASSRPLAWLQTGLVGLQALVPLAALYTLKRAVDAASAAFTQLADQPVTGLGSLTLRLAHDPVGRAVAFWFVAGAGVMAVSACLRVWVAWVAEQHAMAVSDHVHRLLHQKMTEIDLAFFDNTADQDRLHFVQEQAMSRPVAVLGSVYQIFQSVIGLLGVLTLISLLHPVAGLVLVLSGTPGLLLRIYRGRRYYEWRKVLAPLEREAGYFHHLLTSGDAAKEIRVYRLGEFCRQRFDGVRMRLRQARLAWRKQTLREEFGLQIWVWVVASGLLLWMTGNLLTHGITLGALVMYAQAVQRGQGLLGSLVGAIADMRQSALFLASFDELLHLPADVKAPPVPRPVPSPLVHGVVFDHVSFTYPGKERPVLDQVSFTLRVGERIALMGPNGSGKSTILKLLARLYDPDSGRILVDGVDLREFDPQAWRCRLGFLFQDYGCYQLTAAENIRLGDPISADMEIRVDVAARQAGLDECLRQWPQAIDTALGRKFQDGIEPSMGQWQRLAIARALVRQSDLLILDEPTRSLDARSLHDLQRLLAQKDAHRITLIVSHREELVAGADRVLIVAEGRVSEAETRPASDER